MTRLLTTLLLITILSGCKKETHQPQGDKPIDLLTDGKWLLVSFGFDDDSSGTIEDYENMLEDCQEDNTTQYFRNGSGQSRENQLACQSPGNSDFEWKFIDNNKAIEIAFYQYNFVKLTKTELHFRIDILGLNAPAHVIYRKL